MILYHGTCMKFYEKISKDGIKPRLRRRGNWLGNNIGSHPKLVYLSIDKVLEFYPFVACVVNNDSTGVVLSINTDKLDQSLLRADENFIDYEERGSTKDAKCPFDMRKKQRIKAAKDLRWEESLNKMGMAAYRGIIPPDAINLHKIIPLKENKLYLNNIMNYDTVRRSEIIKSATQNFRVNINPNNTEDIKWITPDHSLIITGIKSATPSSIDFEYSSAGVILSNA